MSTKAIYFRVSVEVQRNEFGGSLGYETMRFTLSPETPLVANDIAIAARKAYTNLTSQPLIEAAIEQVMAPPQELESPEMPGPGYDAQTRPVKP